MARDNIEEWRGKSKLVQKWDRQRRERALREVRQAGIAHQIRLASLQRARRLAKGSRMKLPKGEVIYLMRSGGACKIGRTNDLSKRYSAIKCHSPMEVELLHYFTHDDTRAVEKLLHQAFKVDNAHGEWFRLSRQDVAFICGLNSDNCIEAVKELMLGL